jgi:hypothetical protein
MKGDRVKGRERALYNDKTTGRKKRKGMKRTGMKKQSTDRDGRKKREVNDCVIQ